MGLDLVELVMRIEETFSISNSDKDAQKIFTVGQCYDYILSKIDRSKSQDQPCLSSAVFYRLRRGLMEQFAIARSEVTPRAELSRLIPMGNRPMNWDQLAQSIDLALPPLVRPTFVDWSILTLAFVGLGSLLMAPILGKWQLLGIGPLSVLLVWSSGRLQSPWTSMCQGAAQPSAPPFPKS